MWQTRTREGTENDCDRQADRIGNPVCRTALFGKAEKLAASFGEDTVYNYVHPNNHAMIAVFIGSVQGVGFRYRARHAAELYGCTVWVRNEYDGSVVMEIQGTEEQISLVILDVERGMFVRIEYMDAKSILVIEDERGFYG